MKKLNNLAEASLKNKELVFTEIIISSKKSVTPSAVR